jgi:selenocysteine-specific elongation factor
MDGRPDERAELARRGIVRRADLDRMGVAVSLAPVAGDWLADPGRWADLRTRLAEEAARYSREHPLEAGVPVEVLRRALDLPDRLLVEALVTAPLRTHEGRVVTAATALPEPVARAVERIRADLAGRPFVAPDAGRLTDLGVGRRELAAAARAGALLRITDDLVLLPDAAEEAAGILASLPQPFTLSQARQALGTTRRVAVPLLELLDRRGLTRRLPGDLRVVTAPAL